MKISTRDYIDNQVNWIKALKSREREDILRDMENNTKSLREELSRVAEKRDSLEENIGKQIAAINKLVYIGMGLAIAAQIVISLFIKK
jgi:hypothetical protein